MRTFRIAVLLLAVMLPLAVTTGQTSRLQIIHNAADPAADSVNIYLNGSLLLKNFKFRSATPYVDVPAGVALNIGVAPATSMSVADTIKNFRVTLTAGEKYVAIANGTLSSSGFAVNPDGRNTGFTLFIKTAGREAGSGGNVEFAVEHGATDAPTVDVVARNVATLVNNAAYGDITPYIAVPPASYLLDVTDASGTVRVATFKADLSGLANGAAVVFASGFLTPSANKNGKAFGLFAALANGTVVQLPAVTTARLQVIHNAADPSATQVDVYLNGTKLLDNFAFRKATPFIDAPAGSPIDIGVAGASSTSAADTIRNFRLTLTPGETYVAIANGVLDAVKFAANPQNRSRSFKLLIQPLAREKAKDTTKVEFSVVHGATDAPMVNVVARGVGALVNNASYGDITGYISVPAANYTLDVKDSSGTVTVASFGANLSGLVKGTAIVFASGFLTPGKNQNGPGFGLFGALADGTVVAFSPTTTAVKNDRDAAPAQYALSQNYPNPFNPSTQITFSVPKNGLVTLAVYNGLGQEVGVLANREYNAGSHTISFNAANLPTGTYYYRITSGNFTEVRKMMLIK